VGVAKSLKRLAILGLLTCAGAWAQTSLPVRVGLSIPGPIFLVDGQAYTSPQVFQWTVGSNHQVYFLQTSEPNGTLSIHQYLQTPGVRYTFGGWEHDRAGNSFSAGSVGQCDRRSDADRSAGQRCIRSGSLCLLRRQS